MAVFVVTGTRTGIGLETVLQLAASPSNTVVAIVRDLGVDILSLREIKTNSNGTVHIVECDISKPASISGLVGLRRHPAFQGQTSRNLTAESLIEHFMSNAVGPALVTQALIPHLAPGAVVANVTSGAGSLTMLSEGRIAAEFTPYSISKTALNMLTVHQAKQLKSEAIVVAIDPGHVKTVRGGPKAVVEVEASAKGVIEIVKGLRPEDSGKFLLYNGTELPW
ncbi:hypothetical protein AK830_g4638 [Neonectria ditissima]|uniref:Uncharacterized protein n=1 Tax=Neonectria ditissima TaxID=78410 RepID=A0A0P7B640_9HYPO|nr:hypothetical protein AK830_g4638 [Neonectria ditissima]